MKFFNSFQFHSRDEHSVTLLAGTSREISENSSSQILDSKNLRHELTIHVLEKNIFRVVLKRDGKLVFPRTWAIEWERTVPFEGRDKLDLAGFALPEFQFTQKENLITIATDLLELRVDLKGARFEWFQSGVPILSERSTGSIALSQHNSKIWHSHSLSTTAQVFGLGEASGPLNRRERKFEMRNVDAMGYDAEKTDPLYKHYPFYIYRDRGSSVGLFYDNFSTSSFDFGNEIDNYHGPFLSYKAEFGDLDYYVIGGPRVQDVTRTFTKLTGRAMMPPKWTLSYSGSTMTYTDLPNAQEALGGFLTKIEEHRLPCASFHLSSGYTSIGRKRYVFNWNRDKVPDPAGLVRSFREKGVRLIPNIKPVLLTDHPSYEEARELFVRDSETENPELSQFWDGMGSHLDFTNPQARTWWKNKIKDQLLANGIETVWNDNNEFEIWDDEANCDGDGRRWPIKLGRPLQTLLMAMTSREALLEQSPDRRPFVVSRSGMPGLQRYVQTWSGDNCTDWKTLRYNLTMALNLSLSGASNTGHDIGGFSGPRPDAELFLRWIQHGIFYPRFVIHSWKAEGVNEPWMYPEIIPQIRALFELRESLIPYFYQLMKASHDSFEPFMRPLFYEFEHDPKAFEADDQFMVGPSLLIANVIEPGATTRSVYLPAHVGGWFDFKTGQAFEGGQTLTMNVDRDSVPVFVKSGTILPVKTEAGVRFRIFQNAAVTETLTATYFDDDGDLFPFESRHGLTLRMTLGAKPDELKLELSRSGTWKPIDPVKLEFVATDGRKIEVVGEAKTL